MKRLIGEKLVSHTNGDKHFSGIVEARGLNHFDAM